MDKKEEKKNNLQGFKILKLRYSATSTVFHELFVKEHSVRNQSVDKPSGRTLFILNVPQYVREDCFKSIFREAGTVTSVIFQAKPSAKNINEIEDAQNTVTAFKVAYIVFSQTAGLIRALKLKSLQLLTSEKCKIVSGIEKWTKEYNDSIQDANLLKKQVETFMEKYDAEEQNSKQKEKVTVDEDGWTTVTRHSRKPGFARKESVNNKIMEKIKSGKKKKELKNFYTFQIRESKQNKIVELRKKYEEDKMKINRMKQARKFKPY